MASLETLPPDQRAVLQLVLQRGRSYDEIARMLAIDRAAVRGRALAAFDALGPDTGLADHRRALITDYLLGQLPPAVADQTRDRLGTSPSERAWARVLASDLAPLSSQPLPEIPVGPPAATAERPPAAPAEPEWSSPADARPPAALAAGPSEPLVPDVPDSGPEPPPKPKRQSIFASRRARAAGAAGAVGAGAAAASASEAGAAASADAAPGQKPKRQSIFAARRERAAAKEPKAPKPPKAKAVTVPAGDAPRSSRFGGTLLIGATIAVVAIVAIVLLTNGSSKKNSSTSTPSAAAHTTATTPAAATTSTAASSAAAKVLAQINLTPPDSTSKAAGIAEVLQEGSADGIAIVAQHVPPNKTNPPDAYAVWLYNSPNDAHILGFVNPGVGSNGRLSTAGGLPTNASRYKQLIVTVETKANPKVPGTIVLQGDLTGLG
jgi:hypothetical protein